MTEHGAGHGAVHHPGIGELLWPVLNFILFVALLVRFLRGPLGEFFRERTTRVRAALEAGSRARQEAEAVRAALARDVAELPALRERLRADLRAAAERERQTILESGRLAAEHIRSDARLLAEHEVTAARDALRVEVIDEAVRLATALLRTTIRRDDHDRFVREFVSTIGRQP